MKDKGLKVGLVGCGWAARLAHIPALAKNRSAQLVAVCDRDEELARQTAREHGVRSYYTDVSQMLRGEDLRVVDICTPPATHHAISLEAMAAGCHVLVEKPLSHSVAEADEMVDAARQSGVKLCVVHNQLFLPVVLKARSMVAQGAIGEVTGIEIVDSLPRGLKALAERGHWYHRLPGGAFGEMLPHPIYLASAFVDDLAVVAVQAKSISGRDWMPADELRVILEGRQGLVTITESLNWPKDTMTVHIFGTRRCLCAAIHGGVLTRYGAGAESRAWRAIDNVSQGCQLLAGTISTTMSVTWGRYRNGHRTLIDRFIEAVATDAAPPVSGEEGREVVRLWQDITSGIDGSTARG